MTLVKQTQPNLYPGMNDSGIEFFSVEGEVKVISNRKTKDFTETPFAVIQLLKEEIEKSKLLKMALLDWHPNSEFARIEQFAKCRFGGLDFKPDIKHNNLQKGEYWNCPSRENCPNNGVVCSVPTYNNTPLSHDDVKLMKLLSTNLTNEHIAFQMSIPFGSYHKLKQALYEKLGGIQTKQEVALIAKSLNII